MKWNVLSAIFKRDFVSYFSSPTGYVFICVFVVLSALATFWPPDFFADNLANLNQLSRWLPFIMLVFIPAITMSMWAEERRQGTDELLLTIPASDFDVVLGKYLAGVAIFTVALLFSALAIFTVFKYGLGDPDPGLFFSTYLGYWFIGIAMIAIGMAASFLTSNLTVGFILGALLILPMALLGVPTWFVSDPSIADKMRRFSAVAHFGDFERGVISLGGVVYFVVIAIVWIYLSMVLIGRRHWEARKGELLWVHYALRCLAIGLIGAGLTVIFQNRNVLRADVSSEHLGTLATETRELLKQLRDRDDVGAVKIDAYVSPQIPADFTETKLNLLGTLEEFRALGGGKIVVDKHEIGAFGPEAELAEKNFGIVPHEQPSADGSSESSEDFFLGMAVTSGLDKVVTPFINKGIPVEYELIRSIMTVANKERKKVGVIDTGIPMMSTTGSQRGEWPLITELRKQFDVERVDPSQKIRKNFDVLLAVQPSMLDPDSFDHVVDAVRAGTPTAILEDPFPYFYPEFVPGTGQPKQSQMSMFGGGQPEPKGDIDQLWRLLGVRMNPMEVVWQDYSPERSVRQFEDPQWVFIDKGNGAPEPLNPESRITQGLNQVLLLYPGGLSKVEDSKLKFEQLLQTGVEKSGTVLATSLQRFNPQRPSSNRDVFSRMLTRDGYIVGAQITGKPPEDDAALAATADADHDPADDPEVAAQKAAASADQKSMKVVVVPDIDWIIPSFFDIREGGDDQFLPATQNVPLILNIIDSLAGDDRFIEIRKRARLHRTLTKIDDATAEYRAKARDEKDKFIKEISDKEAEARSSMQKKIDDVEARQDIGSMEKEVLLEQVRIREQQKFDAEIDALAAQRRRQIKEIAYERDQEIRAVQERYKLYAILIPPIPPLLLALAVFFRRRELERQGVARERLK